MPRRSLSSAWTMAGTSASDRAALLPLFGRHGGPAAKHTIDLALGDSDPELYDAGVHAGACNWPDATVADSLLTLSKTARSGEAAIGGVAGLYSRGRVPARRRTPKLAMLKQAMPLARRDEERGLILERAFPPCGPWNRCGSCCPISTSRRW